MDDVGRIALSAMIIGTGITIMIRSLLNAWHVIRCRNMIRTAMIFHAMSDEVLAEVIRIINQYSGPNTDVLIPWKVLPYKQMRMRVNQALRDGNVKTVL